MSAPAPKLPPLPHTRSPRGSRVRTPTPPARIAARPRRTCSACLRPTRSRWSRRREGPTRVSRRSSRNCVRERARSTVCGCDPWSARCCFPGTGRLRPQKQAAWVAAKQAYFRGLPAEGGITRRRIPDRRIRLRGKGRVSRRRQSGREAGLFGALTPKADPGIGSRSRQNPISRKRKGFPPKAVRPRTAFFRVCPPEGGITRSRIPLPRNPTSVEKSALFGGQLARAGHRSLDRVEERRAHAGGLELADRRDGRAARRCLARRLRTSTGCSPSSRSCFAVPSIVWTTSWVEISRESPRRRPASIIASASSAK